MQPQSVPQWSQWEPFFKEVHAWEWNPQTQPLICLGVNKKRDVDKEFERQFFYPKFTFRVLLRPQVEFPIPPSDFPKEQLKNYIPTFHQYLPNSQRKWFCFNEFLTQKWLMKNFILPQIELALEAHALPSDQATLTRLLGHDIEPKDLLVLLPADHPRQFETHFTQVFDKWQVEKFTAATPEDVATTGVFNFPAIDHPSLSHHLWWTFRSMSTYAYPSLASLLAARMGFQPERVTRIPLRPLGSPPPTEKEGIFFH